MCYNACVLSAIKKVNDMRISGWIVGVMAFMALMLVTAICSVVAYQGTRTLVIDAWDSGLQVDSPQEVIGYLQNPQGFPTPTPQLIAQQATATITPIVVNPNANPNTQPTPEATVASVEQTLATPIPTLESTPDPAAQYTWNDPRQIRILLLGMDERRGFTNETAYRTDTIILLTIDPVRKTAGLVSFPRDLWVNIPNFLPGKINTANYLGDTSAYPNGRGPGLLMETLKANFGVNVNRYVRVNFDVFNSVVDAISPQGTEICVRESIYDPAYPDEGFGTIEVRFEPGCQRLDATRLLQYARTRKTQGGDFDRARRQQEVLDALRAQALSAGGIQNFLGQIPTLWNELSDSYQTNLTIEEIISLGYLMSEIPRESIQFRVVDENYVTFGKSPDGAEDILIPNSARIAELVQNVAFPQPEVSEGDLRSQALAENVPIQVFNGTNTTGFAGRVQEWLIGRGVQVSGVGNAPDHGSQPTLIKDYGENRATTLYLASVLGLPEDRIVIGNDGLATRGVVIVVGPDIEAILSQP
jgi:polyisoprenyl-teichoic acid--peptidoglycan teichoic acid transferase